jgi:hypothetical protein
MLAPVRCLSSACLACLLVGCAPSPEKVCAHLQELDDKKPMANFSASAVPRQHGGNKTGSCIRQLNELQTVDPALYRSAAKCITKAEHSGDAWDCWVLDHTSPKQPEKLAKDRACTSTCESTKKACNDACVHASEASRNSSNKDLESCTDKCWDGFGDCDTGCYFE